MSWKSEIQTDTTGTWAGNMLRFNTREEAESYVKNLAWRWTSVRETRVVECNDPVNYTWTKNGLEPIKE